MSRMPARIEIDVTERTEAEGARRATGDAALSVKRAPRDPDPEVPAKARRRRFPAAYRLRILKQADACKKAGDVGALLRREGLYSSLLTNWRRQRDQGALVSLVAELFSDLSIDASHSRPRVSNDNPFSEAQFRTFKYRPEFPDRFGSLEDARAICHDLFAWYNDAHHHSGLNYLTPADVHYGRAATVLQVRHRARLAAYAAHPERFVKGPPRPETLPTAVWINPPPNTTGQDAPRSTIVTPNDPQHGVIEGPHSIVGN